METNELERCALCGGGPLARVESEETHRFGGVAFAVTVPALKCPACGERYFAGADLERIEAAAARALARSGVATGAAFRFLRKTADLRAKDLAPLLGVTPETVSRWET